MEEKRNAIYEYIRIQTGSFEDDTLNLINSFWWEYQRRWNNAQRKQERFMDQNSDWLKEFICFNGPCPSGNSGGRPKKSFEDSSNRSKRRKTEDIRKHYSADELLHAATMQTRAEGTSTSMKILKTKVDARISDDHALAIFVDAKLTRSSYEIIRGPAKTVYPCYDYILAAKVRCYPPKDSIEITETHIRANLQALLNHTAQRLIESIHTDTFEAIPSGNLLNLELFLKWGCDGSSGHSEYKVKFSDVDGSDASVFLTSVVPLRLSSSASILWDNPSPSSTKLCRPVNLQFVKETTDVTIAECNRMNAEIQSLLPFTFEKHGLSFKINFKMSLTMIDGKVINAVTRTTSAQRCYLCGATSKMFNNIESVEGRKVDQNFLQFGFGSLHCWIRSFECFLHISYRLKFKKWSKAGHADDFQSSKALIQQKFFELLGLHVDKPRQTTGNSNDGNTARTFFKNSEVASEITGIDLNLINRFKNLLIAISSGENIDAEKFRAYALDTAKLYVSLYGWYHMPTTVHKMLIHGADIIGNAVLPIGRLSEDAQEALNKEIRRLRRDHSRKASRRQTNEDIFHGLLIASDPLINIYRKNKQISKEEVPVEVKAMLKEEQTNEDCNND